MATGLRIPPTPPGRSHTQVCGLAKGSGVWSDLDLIGATGLPNTRLEMESEGAIS